MANFHTVRVKEIIKETENCVSILFDVPSALENEFKYTSGQYLTLKADIAGEDVRRAYSIFTPPYNDDLGVTVKRVENGKMSNFLNDKLKVGDEIEVMKPEGKFVLKPSIDDQRDHYFIAAGSGITPVMSMIKTILEEEPKSTAYLLYGCRDEDNIIFREELQKLAEAYQGQFILEITLSKALKEKSGGLMGILGKKKSNWQGQKGRIDVKKVLRLLDENPPKSEDARYYLCGPGGMIDNIQSILLGNGVEKKYIYQEYFTASDADKKEVDGAAEAKLVAHLDGEKIEIVLDSKKSVLTNLLDAGYDAPYSCTSGACSSCMAKITEGKAEMEVCYALDEDEVADGYILTCQAHATTSNLEIEFE